MDRKKQLLEHALAGMQRLEEWDDLIREAEEKLDRLRAMHAACRRRVIIALRLLKEEGIREDTER